MSLKKSLISYIYLSLSVLGAILPTISNIKFFREYGPNFDITLFIKMANSNPASQSLSFDLLISATAVFIWILIEARRLKMKNIWIVILGTFTIAFAFSAPLFLFLRERRLIELEEYDNNLAGS